MATYAVTVPIRTQSEMNIREHHMAVYRRKKQQHGLIKLFFQPPPSQPPYHIKLTRYGTRKLDQDNLAASFKFIRDAVAKRLAINDKESDDVSWSYDQVDGCKEYSCRIEVTHE